MSNQLGLSFDNTEVAFRYKTDRELKKARFLFSSMGRGWLVRVGTRLMPWAIRSGLPVKGLVRSTIFAQFVGGETLDETAAVARKLGEYNVQVILDYGVEGGDDGEKGFDESTDQFVRVVTYAATQQNIPFASIKVTGFARYALLQKLDAAMAAGTGTLLARLDAAVERLPPDERDEWHRVRERMLRICGAAAGQPIGILVDAEETWIQDPVDALTLSMMQTFNQQRCVVYNTVQHYRHDRLQFLRDSHQAAVDGHFILGAKLVRGAYMEKERRHAEEHGYPSPIQPSKQACDDDYDAGLRYCIEHLDRIALIVASHNEASNLLAARLSQEHGIARTSSHLHFSQLYGMSDNITFNLAHAGFSVSKYLPFGYIDEVIPYLMRRAQENTSVKGQTGRELALIRKELDRRATGAGRE